MTKETFSKRLVDWQLQYGRHNLPWQNTDDPYRIWLSEVMLQQTQVNTVIPYYERFLNRFPDIRSLAEASQEEVMSYWSGLGYYSRARNLHKAAKTLVDKHEGRFPPAVDAIAELPGIGRSTAAAVAAFAFGIRAAILDGNVKRVIARHAGVEGYPGEKKVQDRLWLEAEARLPMANIQAYTQGLMDLGNLVCMRKRPLCSLCPVAEDCQARLAGQVELIPAPRPRKAIPARACRMVIALHEGKVLVFEKRLTGVWQGLLSLPEAGLEEEPGEVLKKLGFEASLLAEWKPFDHVFSHYRLTIYPSLWRVQRALAVADDAYRWLELDTLRHAPLPTPVRRLLESVQHLVV